MTRNYLGEARPPRSAGVVVGLAAVALSTAVVFPLREVAPVVSLLVVYMLGVLVVATVWGALLGSATALCSALAFNYFHIPPTGRFSIQEPENWVALAVFLVAAVLASSVGQAARTRALEAEERRREAALAAEMAQLLVRGERLVDAVPTAAHRLAQALALPSAAIELTAVEGDERRVAFPLREGTRQIGTLLLPPGLPETTLRRLQERVVPALEALLAAGLEREALLEGSIETSALRRSDVLKTALLRSVSHELRSPLTSILTASDALRSSSLSGEERRELAIAVGDDARRLSRLIDNLLDLSRLEADAAEPRPSWCSLEEVIHAALDDLDLPPGRFKLSVDPALPQVQADAVQLERSFSNLLENASRYSGGHPVSVRARESGGRILVRIVDRGPGIPHAQLERVFEPIFRAGAKGSVHRGSGLGLAIVRGFVEANGGRVWIESLPGQGATFVVELPLTPLTEAAGARA